MLSTILHKKCNNSRDNGECNRDGAIWRLYRYYFVNNKKIQYRIKRRKKRLTS
ncbi:hypothetical protein CBL_06684 [Carabus blaptoides fortunei]